MKFLTVSGMIVNGEIIKRLENTVIVGDERGNRHLCRIKDQGIYIPKQADGPKGWKELDLSRGNKSSEGDKKLSKIRAIEPNGDTWDFRSATAAANHYASAYTTIVRNCKSDEPIKTGVLKGYKFDKIS